MPQRCNGLIFSDHRYAPIAVLRILPKKGQKRASWCILRPNTRRLPDLPTKASQTKVEFVVLITHKVRIENSRPIENGPRPTAEINGIHFALVGGVMRPTTPTAKAGLKCSRDRSSNDAGAFRDPRPPNVICSRPLKSSNALL